MPRSDLIDSLNGIETYIHETHDSDKIIFEDRQDAEPLIEANKLLYNDFDNRSPFKGDGMHRVASIPLTVLQDLVNKGILDSAWRPIGNGFLRWLDDPENVHFRTRPGKLSR